MDYDAISEVLSWMPAKSAITYSSSLCRPLHNIHSKPSFIEKQCLHSHGRDTAFFLQHVYGWPYPISSIEFLALSSPESSGILPESLDSIHLHYHGRDTAFFLQPVYGWPYPISSIKFLALSSPESSGILPESLDSIRYHHRRTAAASNDLLLLTHKWWPVFSTRCSSSDVEFSVFNPATGMLASLPVPVGYNIVLGDDVCECSPLIECCSGNTTNSFPNDYNIALVVEIHGWGWRQLRIYANGKWEEELCDLNDENARELRYDMPATVYSKATEGLVVHYLCNDSKGSCIVVFDIRKKWRWRSIKLPEIDDDHHGGKSYYRLQIFKWNETGICLVRWFKGFFQVWVLEKCGRLRCSESWRRVTEMTTEEEMGLDDREGNVERIGVASGRGLLVATKSWGYVYVMEGRTVGGWRWLESIRSVMRLAVSSSRLMLIRFDPFVCEKTTSICS